MSTSVAPVPPVVPVNSFDKPVFITADHDTPTRDELVTFADNIETYITGVRYTLHFLGDDDLTWPRDRNMSVHTGVRAAAKMGQYASQWESHLAGVKLGMARAEMDSIRAQSSQPFAVTSAPHSRLKTPMPSKYKGQKGNLASTFMVACANYRVMEPTAFIDENQCIRWALQQMEDKAGLWVVWQMARMESDLDVQGRPPKEL